jgi:uncharacterized protein
MLDAILARVVSFCVRHATFVIVPAVLLGVISAVYITRHFAVNTDVSRLLSDKLPWRQHEITYRKSFPEQSESVLAVIGGETPEYAAMAAATLVNKLKRNTTLFLSVRDLGSDPFFQRNALLFLDSNAVQERVHKLGAATPLLKILAPDRTLRGLAMTLMAGLKGAQAGQYKLDDMAGAMNMASDTIESSFAGGDVAFSWTNLLNGGPLPAADARRLIQIRPVLNYDALQPGAAATTAVRKAADEIGLSSTFHSKLRLTGPVPISDEEFSTLQEGAVLNGIVSAVVVLVILWLALRSWRLVVAVGVTIATGLAITAALGLWMVGALNPISVAFAILFVGLGADFAIQYSVRYRAERHETGHLNASLIGAARGVGTPLTLAAAAAAVGFFSFLPTDYRGLAELGLIAGCGMLVALITSLTLLPALAHWLQPPPEPEPLGYARVAPVDHFLKRHRIAVVVGTSLIAIAGLPALLHLKFDFDPLSLRDPKSESIATMRELSADPRIAPDAAQLLASRGDAAALRPRLEALSEVASTRSLDNFVPFDQDNKLRAISGVARSIDQALRLRPRPGATDGETVATLKQTAQTLKDASGEETSTGPVAARRLADDLVKLADATPDMRRKVEATFTQTLGMNIDIVSASLHPQRVTLANLPAELVRDWTAPNKDVRVEIAPKGNTNDSETLRRFARAVLAVAPNATGPAIETYEWGRTIIYAFAESAAFALVAIALLLWIVLRRIGDVLLTLIPLLVAAAATLEICALSGFALNYANIIALPVLLGVGVAFKIYYVLAWRNGETNFLQSSLTRAVFFSALMTATAFGSLWLSGHPGTSSMGKLLALSLLCTLASAALFQPALMGAPRTAQAEEPPPRRHFDMSKVRFSIPRNLSRETWNRIRRRSGSQS